MAGQTKTRTSTRTGVDKVDKSDKSSPTPSKGPPTPIKKIFQALSKPANPKCSPSLPTSRDQFSFIRLSVVNPQHSESSSGYALHFHRDDAPNGQPYSSWPDKLFFDALRLELKWLVPLNFIREVYQLHKNDIPVVNTRKFNVRVYLFFTAEPLSTERLRDVASYIRDALNDGNGKEEDKLRDHQKVVVDDFLVMKNHHTWYDVLGHEGSLNLARKLHCQDLNDLGDYFVGNKSSLFTFWGKGQMSANVARRLGLPASMAEELGLTAADFDTGDFSEQITDTA